MPDTPQNSSQQSSQNTPPSISTRVFDTATGAPAAGIPVRLERHGEGAWRACGIAITDANGRAQPLEPDGVQEPLMRGDYRLTFEVAAYFKARETKAFYPFVQVTFSVAQLKSHQVPLLLSPFGYSTFLES